MAAEGTAYRCQTASLIREVIDVRATCLGLLWLAAGVFVYVAARPPGVAFLPPDVSLYAWFPQPLIELTGPLPIFFHVGAMSLLCIGLLKLGRNHVPWVCAAFALTDVLFEIGQHEPIAAWLNERLPILFGETPFINLSRAFFNHGTFDVLDVVAAVVAAIVVYRMTTNTIPPRASQ